MKKTEIKKYRTKSIADLQVEVNKLKVDLWSEIVDLKAGKSSNPTKKRSLKRDISQISTIIHERELQDALIIHERELQDKMEQRTKNQEQILEGNEQNKLKAKSKGQTKTSKKGEKTKKK